VQTQFGWHVILLEDTRESTPPTLENVRGEIITKLQQQALADYMQGLRSESKIVFNEKMAEKKPATDATAEAKPESEGQAQDEIKQQDERPSEGENPTAATPAAGDTKPASE
jgi:peptidyl-prolyl cis-trans isomerase C